MAYEFRACCDGIAGVLSSDRLVLQLADDNFYETKSVNESEIAVRFVCDERRSSWSEDASIYVDDDGMLVAVHSGTEAQRLALIERLKRIYQRSGVDLTFSEV